MGASSWHYFAPYQEDVEQVLQELRREIFEKGEYYNEWTRLKSDVEAGKEAYVARWMLSEDPGADPRQRYWTRKVAESHFNLLEVLWEGQASKSPPPQTIDEVLALWGFDGTHSILDIEKVSSSPQEGTVSPFEREALLTLFGTEKPTREQIEAVLTEPAEPEVSMVAGHRLWDMLTTWEGRYCVVYQNDTPHEFFFAGYSGD